MKSAKGHQPSEGHAIAESAQQGKAKPAGAGFSSTLAIGLLLAVIVIILAVQNTASVKVEFLPWATDLPLVVIILISALAGVVLDELFGFVWRHHRRRQLSDREELKTLRKTSSKPLVVEPVTTPESDSAV